MGNFSHFVNSSSIYIKEIKVMLSKTPAILELDVFQHSYNKWPLGKKKIMKRKDSFMQCVNKFTQNKWNYSVIKCYIWFMSYVDSRCLQDPWQRQWWHNQGQCSGGKKMLTSLHYILFKLVSNMLRIKCSLLYNYKINLCLFTVAAADNVLLSDVKACSQFRSKQSVQCLCNDDFMLYTAPSVVSHTV